MFRNKLGLWRSSSLPSSNSLTAAADSRVKSLTSQFRAGGSRNSAAGEESVSQRAGCRGWPTNGTYIKEEEGAFQEVMDRSRTHNSSTLKQRAQGTDFGCFHSASLSSLHDPSLLGTRLPLGFTIAAEPLPHLIARAVVIPIIISQSSTALCKPWPRFSCL